MGTWFNVSAKFGAHERFLGKFLIFPLISTPQRLELH